MTIKQTIVFLQMNKSQLRKITFLRQEKYKELQYNVKF